MLQWKLNIQTNKQYIITTSDKTPIAVVTDLIKGETDNNIKGTVMRLSKNFQLKLPVNKLYPIKYAWNNGEKLADIEKLTRSKLRAPGIRELRWTFTE